MTKFRLFQTEKVCRRQFQIWRKWQKVIQRVENTVGKGEIARYEQFLLFPQCFQRACFPGASKGVIVWEWVKSSVWLLDKMGFCGICRRQCHYDFNTVFWKSCNVFCAKPKEVDPLKSISVWQISVSIVFKYIINKRSTKINWISALIIEIHPFSLIISISATEFYWRNDIHNLSYLAVFFQNQFVLELVRPVACSLGVFRHIHVFFFSNY